MMASSAKPPSPVTGGGPGVPIMEAREGVLHLTDFRLHHGGCLPRVDLRWRLEGDPSLPTLATLGGISANRCAFAPVQPGAGWWSEVVGPGKALDSGAYCLLGLDYLGTGSAGGEDSRLPPISSHDQARLLNLLCDALEIPRLAAIAGASYGGMVALAFAQSFAQRVDHILVISAAHRASPLSTAWRSVEREAVRLGLAHGDGPAGLRLARALAMATYRTREEFDQRFGGEPEVGADRAWFPVERYLLSRGDAYIAKVSPGAFMTLSESIDLHSVRPEAIQVPATLVAIRQDQLVPVEDMRELAARLPGPARLVEIDSHYGHDAFLKEGALLAPIFAEALGDDAA
ncbi:MAG: homoserine O-succinyltransferase MetX [Steroidobacteraceae bacterium]